MAEENKEDGEKVEEPEGGGERDLGGSGAFVADLACLDAFGFTKFMDSSLNLLFLIFSLMDRTVSSLS